MISSKFKIQILAILITVCYALIRGGNPAIPTGDSLANLNCAQSLSIASEHSFPYYCLKEDGFTQLVDLEVNTIWPPGTSFLVSRLMFLGFNLNIAVEIYISLFIYLNLILCFYLVRCFRIGTNVSLVISLLYGSLWQFSYWCGLSLMAESLFMTISMASFIWLNHCMKNKGPWFYWFILGLIAGLSYYVKSASPGFILAVVLTVFIYSKGIKNKILKTSICGLGVFISVAPWLVRNISYGTLGSEGSGPQTHAILVSSLSFIRLFIPKHGGLFENLYVPVLMVLFLITIITYLWYNKLFLNKIIQTVYDSVMKKQNIGPMFSIIYGLSFLMIMFFAMYILPLASHIETRYWLTLFPFIAASFYKISKTSDNSIVKRKNNRLLILLSMIILGANLVETYSNLKKNWTVLFSEKKYSENRLALSSMITNFPAVFHSNYDVRFETENGLTSWPLDNLDTSYFHYFIEYPPNNNYLSLGKKKEADKSIWLSVKKTKDYNLYKLSDDL